MPYIGGEDFITDKPLTNLTLGKRYKAQIEGDYLRVWDDFGEDYLYPKYMFSLEAANSVK
jgi:hypothetical protein